jgi:hypothetical protein
MGELGLMGQEASTLIESWGDALVHLIKEGGDVDMTIVLPYREESDERRLREGKWASAGP